MDLNEVTGRIIGAAITVHRALGPGLLESTYQACLVAELRKKGLRVREQVAVPIVYDDVLLECGYRMDLLVEERVVVELKAVAKVDRVFLAQLLTYLEHSGCTVGLLLNFNVEIMVEGVHRVVRGFVEDAVTAVNAESAEDR